MQQGEHSSVNNSRPAGEEVTGTRKKGVTEILEKRKKRKRDLKVLFKREPLIIFHGLTKYFLCDDNKNKLIGLSMFQSLLCVYRKDGLDECEISRSEILSQSAPDSDCQTGWEMSAKNTKMPPSKQNSFTFTKIMSPFTDYLSHENVQNLNQKNNNKKLHDKL